MISVSIFFLLSFFGTYLVYRFALKKAFLAQVNERSIHTVPTPHGGGIAIAVTWFGALFWLYHTNQIDNDLFMAFLGGLPLALIGLLDDLYDLSPKTRLTVQFSSALWGLMAIWNWPDFWWVLPFALLFVVWFINLFNFLDGIDGYAASEALFLALAGFLLFHQPFYLFLAAAVGGFLILNWHPAKIFMGDIGSTLIGYTIAIVILYHAFDSIQNLWIWLALCTPFWLDATITLIRRYLNNENLASAHRKHAYQRLVRSGWSHRLVTFRLLVLNLIIAVLVSNISPLLALMTTIMICMLIYISIEKIKAFE